MSNTVANWVRAVTGLLTFLGGAWAFTRQNQTPIPTWALVVFCLLGLVLVAPAIVWSVRWIRARWTDRHTKSEERRARATRREREIVRVNELLRVAHEFIHGNSGLGLILNECNQLTSVLSNGPPRPRPDLVLEASIRLHCLTIAGRLVQALPERVDDATVDAVGPLLALSLSMVLDGLHNFLNAGACDQARPNIERVCLHLNALLDRMVPLGYPNDQVRDWRLVSSSFPSRPEPKALAAMLATRA
jgi:hypothetical protein